MMIRRARPGRQTCRKGSRIDREISFKRSSDEYKSRPTGTRPSGCGCWTQHDAANWRRKVDDLSLDIHQSEKRKPIAAMVMNAVKGLAEFQQQRNWKSRKLTAYSHCPPLITGLAGSQGPITTFLYLCKPISHQLHPPIPTALPIHHITAPATTLFHPPSHNGFLLSVVPKAAPAPMTSARVNKRCPRQLKCRRCRLKTGKRPNTSMLNNVKLNTCVVLGSLDANTVLAINAAFVLKEAGNFTPTPPL